VTIDISVTIRPAVDVVLITVNPPATPTDRLPTTPVSTTPPVVNPPVTTGGTAAAPTTTKPSTVVTNPATAVTPVATSAIAQSVPTQAFGAAETTIAAASTFIAPAKPIATVGGVSVDTAVAAAAAMTTAAVFLPTGPQSLATYLPQNPVIYGADGPVAAVADAADVLQPPIVVADAPPAVVPPRAQPIMLVAAIPAPAAVAVPQQAEEEAGTPWTWVAAVSTVVVAAGYWFARRYNLVKRLAAQFRAPALPARA
jgi:hypothetical protein